MKPYIVRPTYESTAHVYKRTPRREIGYLIGGYDSWFGYCQVRRCWTLERRYRRDVAEALWEHYLDEHKEHK